MKSLLPRILLAAVCSVIAVGFCAPGDGDGPCVTTGLAYAMAPMAEINVRTKVMATDKHLKMLDFIEPDGIPEEWKALFAGVDLGPAPEVGREVNFNPQRLVYHLQQFISTQGVDPKQTKIQLPDSVTVTRQQTQMTREQIEEIYREFVLKNVPGKAPEDLVIQMISFSSIPALPSGNLSYQVTASPHEHFMGNVSVTIHFYVDGKEIRNMRVSGKVELYQEVIHSARFIKRNEVISDSDIQLLRARISDNTNRYVTQRSQVVGKRLLHDIGPNEPIGPRDMDQPPLIKRGDPVTMVFQLDGIKLSTRGEAKENGAQGGRIRIKNTDSNKNVLCQVIDAQTVEVLP
jgi:flagellar basal body P-ring formation protein FlgA